MTRIAIVIAILVALGLAESLGVRAQSGPGHRPHGGRSDDVAVDRRPHAAAYQHRSRERPLAHAQHAPRLVHVTKS